MKPLPLLLLPLMAALAVALACGSPIQKTVPTITPSESSGGNGGLVRARVVDVVDGVTIDVEIDDRVYRVSYLGVEIPTVEDGQIMASKAMAFNRFLLEGRSVDLEKGVLESDAYGNLLRYVYVDGDMVNRTLVVNGYATVAAVPSSFRHQTSFLIAEEGAKSGQRGLWKSTKESEGQGAEGESPAASVATAPGSQETPSSSPQFFSSLPALPGQLKVFCDYSGSQEAVIKGNVDGRTGDHVYHIPSGLFYNTIEIEEAQGDRLICTEEEAIRTGWKRSKR